MKRSILVLLVVVWFVSFNSPTVLADLILDQHNVADTPGINASISSSQSLAQTFTAGFSRQLLCVELALTDRNKFSQPHVPTDPLVIEIREVDSTGFPIGTLLAQKFLYEDDIQIGNIDPLGGLDWGWNRLDLSSDNIFLTRDKQYSIVLWSNAPSWSYVIQASDSFDWNGDPAKGTLLYQETMDPVTNPNALSFYDWYVGGGSWVKGPFQTTYIQAGYTHHGVWLGEDLMFRTYVTPVPSAFLLGSIGLGMVGWHLKRKANQN